MREGRERGRGRRRGSGRRVDGWWIVRVGGGSLRDGGSHRAARRVSSPLPGRECMHARRSRH